MPKRLSDSDFRAFRVILNNKEIMGTDKHQEIDGIQLYPHMPDLISKDSWAKIMYKPDNVSIDTSNEEGGILDYLCLLLDDWQEGLGLDNDNLTHTLLDIMNGFSAAIYNLLSGFYMQTLHCLRCALELASIAVYFSKSDLIQDFGRWRSGEMQMEFGRACDNLTKLFNPLESHLYLKTGDRIFQCKDKRVTYEGGWARRLHSELSDYSHLRPKYNEKMDPVTFCRFFEPIYIPFAFDWVAAKFLEVTELCYILMESAFPMPRLHSLALHLFELQGIGINRLVWLAYEYIHKLDCNSIMELARRR